MSVPARPPDRALPKPVRKDERVIAERGLYIESWLPERRSRRKPLYLLHGELAGSWLWERYLGYFAARGWEAHALNLRAHFWSETADFSELDVDTYAADAVAGSDNIGRPTVVFGHGMGGLLALKVAEARPVAAIVLLSPALPRELRASPAPRPLSSSSAHYRQDQIGWALSADQLARENPDLSDADVLRIRHLLGAESRKARAAILEGVSVERERLPAVPSLVIGGGLDRLFPEHESERLAEWLGAEYESFPEASHFGLVVGERSFEPVAERVRSFLEGHRL